MPPITLQEWQKPEPSTEAEAVRLALAEDEERARKLGLKSAAGRPPGKAWTDQIGGGLSADDKATRVLQEEAKEKARKRAAAANALRSAVVLAVIVMALAALGTIGADYAGMVNLGLFPRSVPVAAPIAPPVSVITAPAPVAAPSAPAPEVVPVVVVSAPPIAQPTPTESAQPAPRPIDPFMLRKTQRMQEQVDAKQRGVDTVTKDLGDRRSRIEAELIQLYGIVPKPRDAIPARWLWQSPCAAIEQEAARGAPYTNANYASWSTRVQNADAAVMNLNTYLTNDRKLEVDISRRLEKATKDRDAAKAALNALGDQ